MGAEIRPQIIWQPRFWKQEAFLTCPAYEILYGGAAGGGKSDALIGKAIEHCLRFKNAHVLILRRTFGELEKSLILRAHEILSGHARWQGQEKRYHFDQTNSFLEFGHCQHEHDVFQYKSAEYSLILIDEVTQFTQLMVDVLKTRNRSSKGVPCQMAYATNPGEVGHGWVKERFMGETAPQSGVLKEPLKIYTDTDGMTSCFIPSTLDDNVVLTANDPNYGKRLEALKNTDPGLYQAMRWGNWEVFAGQFFTTWNRAAHVVEPFKITNEFKIYISLDWGYAKPLACHWWAVEPSGRHVYCIREYYVTKKDSPTAAREIHEINIQMFGPNYISLGRVYGMFVDPSIFAIDNGKAIAEDFHSELSELVDDGRKRGLLIIPADNERIPGWSVFRNMLAIQPDGKPFCQWFSTCHNAIRTIPWMVHDKNRPEDLDTDGEDHACDSARYFFIMRFGPKKIEPPKPYENLKDDASKREWENVHNRFFKREKKGLGVVLGGVGR
jgi:PBSX family phage terminase large subunit